MNQVNKEFIPSFDGEKLYCEVHQNAQRPKNTVICLHGLGGDVNYIKILIANLLKATPSTRCIVYDARGQGLSSNNFDTGKLSYEVIAAHDLQQVCQHYRVKNYVLVGHSFGGIAIQTYLSQALTPLPKSVILISTPVSLPPLSLARKFWFGLLKKSKSDIYLSRSTPSHLVFKNSHDFNPKRVWNDIKATGINQLLLLYLSVLGWKNPKPELLNNQNTTIVFGKKDALIWPRQQHRILASLPKARHLLLDANHHQIYLTHPKKLTTIIRSYFG